MAVATKEPKSTTRTLHGVTTVITCKLDKATRGELDNLNADGTDLVVRIDEWRADQDQLYLTAGGMIIDDAIERRTELSREQDALQDAYRSLAWRQFALRPLLLPFYQQAAKAAAAEAERVLQTTLEQFSEWGIDEHAIPHGDFNIPAANQQLRFRALQETQCMAATAAANRAAADLRVLQSQIGVAVSPDSCRITWTVPSGVSAAVLRLLGV